MSEAEAEPIWGGTVDDQRYTVRVFASEESNHVGRLTVVHNPDEETILDEQVTVMYGAIFGADVSDVAIWQGKALEAIDAHYVARGETPPDGS